MRKKRRRPLARTKVNTDKIYFFDRVSFPDTYQLSPFYMCKFYLNGHWWKSVIHYYQASKTNPDDPRYQQIVDAKFPESAKAIGSAIEVDDHLWSSTRYYHMRSATYAKFSQNKECMTVLVSTGTKPLIEHSHDPYWGGRNYGENQMGRVLEEVRTEIRKKLRLE